MEADNGEADFDRPHRPAWTKKRSFAEAFKRGRKGRQRQSGRVGPRSMEECAAWFSRFSAMLPTTDMSILQKVFKKKFVVTSDYSGVGFFEIAIAALMKDLNSDGNDSTEAGEAGDVECYRASDIDRACRSCLLQHTGKSRPTHVFGDITHRYSRNIRHKMRAVQRYWKHELPNRVKGGMSRTDAVHKFGDALLDQLMNILQAETAATTGRCYRCDRYCPLWPPRPPQGEGMLHLHAAGTTCVDFSQSGKQLGLLGASTIPFAVWLVDRLLQAEGIIFHECTPWHPGKRISSKVLASSTTSLASFCALPSSASH